MKDVSVTAYGKDFSYIDDLATDSESKYCIYGCGANGEIICKYLEQKGKNIEYFVDNQANIREFFVLDKKVISPNTFFKMQSAIKVLVSPDNQAPIIEYLIANGVKRENIIQPFKLIEKQIHELEEDYDIDNYINNRKKNINGCKEAVATIYTIAYNTPRELLCRTIESVLDQTLEELEYLFIDNGSTDETASIIKKYAECDSRIKYIRLEKNVPWADRGILAALRNNINTGYVAMVDSDDYYEPDFLEKALNIARTDNSDIVQVNTLTYAYKGFRYSYFSHCLGKDYCVEDEQKELWLMLRIINTPTWGKLIKSSLFMDFLNMMQSYESEEERDRHFCLDISWVAYLVMASIKVSLCDELLHIRTWRPGSSEHSDNHGPKWLSSMVWAFNHIKSCKTNTSCVDVYEDTALNWVFSLQRENYSLDCFYDEDISYPAVQSFLKRPLCDKYS